MSKGPVRKNFLLHSRRGVDGRAKGKVTSWWKRYLRGVYTGADVSMDWLDRVNSCHSCQRGLMTGGSQVSITHTHGWRVVGSVFAKKTKKAISGWWLDIFWSGLKLRAIDSRLFLRHYCAHFVRSIFVAGFRHCSSQHCDLFIVNSLGCQDWWECIAKSPK